MRNILVIAEHDNQRLNNSTLNTIAAAMNVPDCTIDILVIGSHCEQVANALKSITHINKICCVDSPIYAHHDAENMADMIVSLAKPYQYIMAPATTFGKNFLPRVAALLDVEQISDVSDIQTDDQGRVIFVHPIYAGNALETLISTAPIQVLTVRVSAFSSVTQSIEENTVEMLEGRTDLMLSQYVSIATVPSVRPELTQAKIIVSGGRGFQNAEKFKLIEALADKLNAAIGASRAAVDAGFAPNDYQVGQTGKIVAPDLYIALGISGAIQHLAGMKDSRVIVAINKDPEAPIFKIATYGLVGDLFVILPELIEAL